MKNSSTSIVIFTLCWGLLVVGQESSLTPLEDYDTFQQEQELVLQAQEYADAKKYVMADVPRSKLAEVEKIVPGIGGPTVLEIAGNKDFVAVHAVVAGKDTYQVVRDLKKLGAKGILTMPIERMVE